MFVLGACCLLFGVWLLLVEVCRLLFVVISRVCMCVCWLYHGV